MAACYDRRQLVIPEGGWGRPGAAGGGRSHLVMYRGGQLAKFMGEKKSETISSLEDVMYKKMEKKS